MTDPVQSTTPDQTGAGSISTPNLYGIAPVQSEEEQLAANRVYQQQMDMAGDLYWQQERLKDRSQVSTWQDVKDGFGSTALASMYDIVKDEGVVGAGVQVGHKVGTWLGDMVGIDVGKSNYDKQKYGEELLKDVPIQYWDSIMQYDDLGAAQRARGRIMADLERQRQMSLQRGGGAVVAQMAGSLIDVDLPLMLASDGSWGSVKLARAGYKAGRFMGLGRALAGRAGSALDGAVLGAESMAVVGGVKLATDDTSGVDQLIHGVLAGATLGAAFGGVLGTQNMSKELARIQKMHIDNSITRPISEVDTDLHAGREAEGAYTPAVELEIPAVGEHSNSASTSDAGSGAGMNNTVDMVSKKSLALDISTEQAMDQQTAMRGVLEPLSAGDRRLSRLSSVLGYGDRNATHINMHNLRNLAAEIEHADYATVHRFGGPKAVRDYLKKTYQRIADAGFGDEVLPIQSKAAAIKDLDTVFAGKHPDELAAAQDLIRELNGNKAPTLGQIGRPGGVYYHGTAINGGDADAIARGEAPKSNSVSVGKPFMSPSVSTFFHEVGHWAYSNILTTNDRLAFWDMMDKNLGRTNLNKLVPDGGTKSNSMHGPQELFANQFDVYMTKRMSNKYTALADRKFWERVTGYYEKFFDWYNSTPVDRDLETLFEKIAPRGAKRATDPALLNISTPAYKRAAQAGLIGDRPRPAGDSYRAPGPSASGATYLPDEKKLQAFTSGWMTSTGAKAALNNLANTPFGKLVTGNWPAAQGSMAKYVDIGHNAITRFANAVGNDTMRLAKSASPTANWFFLNVFESPTSFGRGVVSSTAASLAAKAEQQIGSTVIRMNSVAWQWAKANGKTMSMLNRPTGVGISREGARSLYREVRLNMNDIQMGRAPRSGSDPHIAQLIEMAQKHADESLKWLKGNDPKYAVHGMENIEPNPGYLPQLVDGSPISEGITNGRFTREAAVDAFTKGYVANGLPQDIAEKVAGAVVSRALNRALDVDTGMIDLLSEDGRTFLRDRLINENKLPLKEVDSIMEHLTGMAEERGKVGFTKHRNNMDMDIQVNTLDGSDLRLVDFMNNNIPEVLARYRKSVAGAGALARKGIRSRKELETFQSVIQKEMQDAGEEAIPSDHMRAMTSDFFSGPKIGYANGAMNKGIDPTISIGKKIANLSLLANFGITQMIDSANSMAADGLMHWVAHTKAFAGLDKSLRETDNNLLDDLSVLTGEIGMDHHIFMEHKSLDDIGKSDSWAWMHGLRQVVHDMAFVQQYTSLFNTVRSHQQKVAASIVANKVMRAIKNGTDAERLTSDLGISPALQTYLKTLIDNNTIEFKTVNGTEFVNRLNADKWSGKAADDFGAIMMRAQNTLVMKNMIGETDSWMHTNAGAVLTHLKMFPISAITKQMVRHGRFMDSQTMGSALYGVALAYMVLKVQDVMFNRSVNERDQAMRAIGYSNMLGWIPMAVDPTMTMLGLDDYRMQRYGKSYETTIPTMEVANKLMKAAGGISNLATFREPTKAQKNGMLAIPFVKTLGIGTWLLN